MIPQGSGGYRLTQKDLARPSCSKNAGMRLEYQGGGGASVSSQVQSMGFEEGAACQAVSGLVLVQPSAISSAGVYARMHICKEARGSMLGIFLSCFSSKIFKF